jgi:hypothetical protein
MSRRKRLEGPKSTADTYWLAMEEEVPLQET